MRKIKEDLAGFLSRTPPFSSASASEVRWVASVASERAFAAGDPVFLEGGAPAAAWIVRSGGVRILTHVHAARMFQLERFGPGQLFGICCRLDGASHRYPCTAVAEEELVAVRIPDAAFRAVYQRSSGMSRAACEICVRRLRSMRRRIQHGRRPVLRRLIEALLSLRQTGGDDVAATRHALATWIGAAPETVFRSLAYLRRRGLVSTSRGAVRILDAAALAAEADGDDDVP